MQTFMVFDVESVGLHGEGFAVGYVVIQDGQEVESGYWRCSAEEAVGTHEDFLWVNEYVVPASLASVRHTFWEGTHCGSPQVVRERFWLRWLAWKVKGAMLAADCPWPVEARFLADCIRDVPHARKLNGPYPLIDVASVRLAVGLNPLGTEGRQGDELPKHHPTADARQSARLLIEALNARPAAKGGRGAMSEDTPAQPTKTPRQASQDDVDTLLAAGKLLCLTLMPLLLPFAIAAFAIAGVVKAVVWWTRLFQTVFGASATVTVEYPR